VIYPNIKIAAHQNGLSASSIIRRCQGIIISDDKNGFHWEYKKE